MERGACAVAESVHLRPFPYPYRAALALCPDGDGLTEKRRLAFRPFTL